MSTGLLLIALCAYGVLIPLWWNPRSLATLRHAWGLRVLGLALTAHAFGIASALFTHGTAWLLRAEHAIAVIALTCAATYAAAARNPHWHALGGVFLSLIFFWQLIAVTHDLLFVRAAALDAHIHSLWLPIHLLIAMITFALLLMGAVSGLIYWASERQLKRRRIGAQRFQWPSLPVQERMIAAELSGGVVGLTLTIATGVILQAGLGQRSHMWLPLIGWGIYSAVLHGHYARNQPARRMILLSLLGFLVIAAAFAEAHRTV